MRISVFTGRFNDSQRTESVRTATAVAREHEATMLVLPGYSLGQGNSGGRTLQGLADAMQISILGETTDTFLFRPAQHPIGPFIQRFSQGTNATQAMVQRVAEEFTTGQRIIQLEQRSIGVLLCGENNFLRNVRSNRNEPKPRHPSIAWPLVYDVLVNPAHSSMGQWNLLHKRFAYFSQSGRTLLYCTNNSHASWRTSLCVYQDGKKVVMGDFEDCDGLQTYVSNDWRLITAKIP